MITININTKPDVDAGIDRTICFGASTNLSATGAVNYQWSPSTGLSCSACANPLATPATTTLYRVVGVAANGCSDTDFVNVTVNPLPNVAVTGITTICAGSNTILVASGATSYVWTPAGSLSCSTCSNPVASPAATTSYVVTGTDANGCTDTGKITITVNPLPVLQTTGSGTICEGTTRQLNVTGAANYNWSPATNLSCIACSNPVASPTTTTTYTVTGTTNGCSISATVTVNVLPMPVLYVSSDQTICEGGKVNLSVGGAATYVWTPSSGLSCTTCVDPEASPASTTTYLVTGTSSDGCSNTASVKVTVNPKPKVDAGEDIVICEGSSAQLQVTGTDTYTWTPSATLSCSTCSNPVAKPLTNTTYTVIGQDNIGCSDSDKVTVSIIERGPVTYGPDAEFCIGGSAELYATGGSSYTWIPSDGLNNHQQAKVKAAPNNTTKYTVIVKQGDCFVDTGYINVTVHPLPVVELGPDVTIGGGNSTQLRAAGDNIVIYSWTPYYQLSCDDCSSPVASPRRTTEYKVNVTDRYGCEGSDNITVRVLCENGQIFIPNTFTPNGDGINDMFFPQGKGLDYVKSFRVYSRWGELVFSRDDMKINDPASGWDGTFKNTPLKPDVFVYVIRAYCESGELIELKGDISLVR
ncbi:MAG: gliding motility-associated C-terminal domain-containing protein [Chitinophagales bacterium]|nr:gliding motility-associated C-terminal domain-containing protein [Chitinophagales bacterium]